MGKEPVRCTVRYTERERTKRYKLEKEKRRIETVETVERYEKDSKSRERVFVVSFFGIPPACACSVPCSGGLAGPLC